jgi:hypothetical protein
MTTFIFEAYLPRFGNDWAIHDWDMDDLHYSGIYFLMCHLLHLILQYSLVQNEQYKPCDICLVEWEVSFVLWKISIYGTCARGPLLCMAILSSVIWKIVWGSVWQTCGGHLHRIHW